MPSDVKGLIFFNCINNFCQFHYDSFFNYVYNMLQAIIRDKKYIWYSNMARQFVFHHVLELIEKSFTALFRSRVLQIKDHMDLSFILIIIWDI